LITIHDMTGEYVDLEYNSAFVNEQYKTTIKWIKRTQHKIKPFLFAFLVITLSLMVRFGQKHLDVIADAATAITMDETSYTPFKLLDEVSHDLDTKSGTKFPIKSSTVNKRMQISNLIDAEATVRSFLQRSRNICVHLRSWGVEYDVLFFSNFTAVNPIVVKESDERTNVRQTTMQDEVVWADRATSIHINYNDVELRSSSVTLYYDNAYCFAFYSMP
jgi:hypothetical protein